MISPYVYAGTFNNFVSNEKLTRMRIMKSICEYLNLDFNKVVKDKTRLRSIVYARHLYAYFGKKYTNYSLTELGKFINKDHATIIHSNKVISNFITVEKDVANDVRKINNILINKVASAESDRLDEIAKNIMKKYERNSI